MDKRGNLTSLLFWVLATIGALVVLGWFGIKIPFLQGWF